MSWITVAKPTSSTYSRVNPQGKEQYDQSSISYDDSLIYYDGVNSNLWSKISKPQGYGFLTWEDMSMIWDEADWEWGSSTDNWNSISKPTN